VVRGTVPDRCVVAGVPARVVRQYVPGDGWSRWSVSPAPERLQGVAQAPDPPG
jgi:serine acetyltransferase